jgi:hypothetical protein
VTRIAYLIAIAAGVWTWLHVARTTGEREAWDNELYFTTALPAIALVAAILSVIVPRRPWRWAFVPFAAQAATAFAQNPTGSLMPLGLIVFAIFGALCAIPAYVGAWIGRKIRRPFGQAAPRQP